MRTRPGLASHLFSGGIATGTLLLGMRSAAPVTNRRGKRRRVTRPARAIVRDTDQVLHGIELATGRQ